MRSTVVVGLLLMIASASSAAPARQWQTGILRDVQIVRPKVVFGIATPSSSTVGGPATDNGMREIRTYVIETDELRLELKETTTANAPRIRAEVGSPVRFALEKSTVYVKDEIGREHKLSLIKKNAIK
jgi:hypothetical protein